MNAVVLTRASLSVFLLGLLAACASNDDATSTESWDSGGYDEHPNYEDAGTRYDTSVEYDTSTSSDAGGSYDTSVATDTGSSSTDTGSTATEPDPDPETSGETYAELVENEFIDTADDNLATFSVDVDTASYGIARRDLHDDRLPVPEGVRVEEYLNFFDYGYSAPKIGIDDAPFTLDLQAGPSVFGDELHMLRIGMQGAVVADEDRLPANIVFLVDSSGSMYDDMTLVRYSLSVLVEALRPDDRISIVTYAGNADTVLPSTPVSHRAEIYQAISELSAGGGTWGEGGIVAAYNQAEAAFMPGGTNRVVICTDGDFNLGLQGEPLNELVESYRDREIFLTGLGYGTGNYNDAQLEELTNRGNGNYTYIADRNDALHVLRDNVTGMMQVIAADVKLQIELNPDLVSRYRIVGYDNRILEDWEFVDDTVDAAEVGAGQNVTAMLELELHEDVDWDATDAVLATVLSRFKYPGQDTSTEISREFMLGQLLDDVDDYDASTQWALGVAEFAEILRHSHHSEGDRFDDIEAMLTPLTDDNVDREELVYLVGRAAALWE